MPFTQPTLTQAVADLSARLSDPANVTWVADELTLYLQEAISFWQSATSLWRDRGTIAVAPPNTFYDIPTELPALRGQTVTNWDLVTQLEYMLLEPAAPGGTWMGSQQFTLAQINGALERRRDMFLRETGAVVTRSTLAVAAPAASGRIAFSEDLLVLRRLAWTPDAIPVTTPLIRDDAWSAQHYAPRWTTDVLTEPYTYGTSDTPPLVVQLVPAPTLPGTLDICAIQRGPTLAPLAETALGVPNDWAWVVLYGALMDLLQADGLALDPGRAAYCQSRWDQGVAAAQAAPCVLSAFADGVPISIDALTDADRYSPLWQSDGGAIGSILTSGQTLLACWPPPPGAGAVLTLDVVCNAPQPTVGTDVLQVTADVYDAILDYAQHLAVFKLGPAQLEASVALLDRAARAAGTEVRIQQASQPSRRPLLAQTAQEEGANARVLPAMPVA
jgi:hypothetical protein